jgi:hypothetical protein
MAVQKNKHWLLKLGALLLGALSVIFVGKEVAAHKTVKKVKKVKKSKSKKGKR